MMAGRVAGLVLAAALAASGCGSTRVPETVAAREQTATRHRLDIADCKAEVGYRNNYNADVSPTGNMQTLTPCSFTSSVASGVKPNASRQTARPSSMVGVAMPIWSTFI